MKGYMYILECSDGSYYTGSTTDLELRLAQHQNGEGANHTRKRLPVKLVYYEEFQRIDEAFYREKQVQGWSRNKKEALIKREYEKLPELSKSNSVASTGSATGIKVASINSATRTSSATTTTSTSSVADSTVPEPVEVIGKNDVTNKTVPELVEGTPNNTKN